MDMRLKRTTAPSSCLITIPFPLETAAWRKGDRADLAVGQSVPIHPSSHHSSPFLFGDGWMKALSLSECFEVKLLPTVIILENYGVLGPVKEKDFSKGGALDGFGTCCS